MSKEKKASFNGNRLKFLLFFYDLTLQELGNEMEISRQLVHHWTSGRRTPKKPYLDFICKFFNIDKDFFTDETIDFHFKGNDLICKKIAS